MLFRALLRQIIPLLVKLNRYLRYEIQSWWLQQDFIVYQNSSCFQVDAVAVMSENFKGH